MGHLCRRHFASPCSLPLFISMSPGLGKEERTEPKPPFNPRAVEQIQEEKSQLGFVEHMSCGKKNFMNGNLLL